MEDTIRGLILLGLPDQYSKYAAYALHTVFSYPTSESWIPSTDTNFPIHVNKMVSISDIHPRHSSSNRF
jgi:hypothetical protein